MYIVFKNTFKDKKKKPNEQLKKKKKKNMLEEIRLFSNELTYGVKELKGVDKEDRDYWLINFSVTTASSEHSINLLYL